MSWQQDGGKCRGSCSGGSLRSRENYGGGSGQLRGILTRSCRSLLQQAPQQQQCDSTVEAFRMIAEAVGRLQRSVCCVEEKLESAQGTVCAVTQCVQELNRKVKCLGERVDSVECRLERFVCQQQQQRKSDCQIYRCPSSTRLSCPPTPPPPQECYYQPPSLSRQSSVPCIPPPPPCPPPLCIPAPCPPPPPICIPVPVPCPAPPPPRPRPRVRKPSPPPAPKLPILPPCPPQKTRCRRVC